VQYGVGVAVTEVGGFHSWRFEGAKPGEGDMTFEGSDGGGFVWSRARGRGELGAGGQARNQGGRMRYAVSRARGRALCGVVRSSCSVSCRTEE
jgi:hypothetical protein